MRVLVRSFTLAVGAAVAVASVGPVESARAASPKEIDTAIQRGMNYLKGVYKDGNCPAGDGTHDSQGAGAAALAGLALLEGGAAPNEPAVVSIAGHVRKHSYNEGHTYQLGLMIMFLDRLADPADVPIIQMLAVRLLAGQNPAGGGWTYASCQNIPQGEAQRLEAAFRSQPMGLAPGQQARSLHPEVARHAQAIWATRDVNNLSQDNSNTQFGLLALWIARKHGVNAEDALVRVEQRFINSQLSNGTWGYTAEGGAGGSPSMTCVGLMALATGIGRQQERRLTAATKIEPKTPVADKGAPKTDDPFFPAPKKDEPKKERVGVAPTGDAVRDAKINLGFAALGQFLAVSMQQGGLVVNNPSLGNRDLYFLWCLERVGVIFGKDRIGGVDWYEQGANALVRSQAGDGSWGVPGYIPSVNASFAVLFLSKSNVVRDLSSKIQGDDKTKGSKEPKDPLAKATPMPEPEPEVPIGANGLPDNDAGKYATVLLGASGSEWKTTLAAFREKKGSEFTYALALAINNLEGERRREAREALAERLTRMTATGLRAMLKADDPEVRRAAALACGMKDAKAHVADLIERLTDDEEYVARAALASLKSLTGQDHGPGVGATKDQRKAAADAWRAAVGKKK